jgi:hypothetical protein
MSVSKKDEFNEKSLIRIKPNLGDVDTRPGMKRTGRVLSVHFRHETNEEALAIPEVAMKYARIFCQGVRSINFWNTLIQYKDSNGNQRYRLDQQLPSLLTSDIVSNSNSFVNYSSGKRSTAIGGTNDTNLVIYCDGAAAPAAGINFTNLSAVLNLNGFSTINGANVQAGQHHQLTAIRQIYNLTIDSIHSFGNNLDIYRRWLSHTYKENAHTATGTPLHNFLGEKYASHYEQFIMDHWQQLGLESPVPPDLFLPLECILALEKVEDVKKFLWAGVHMKKLSWYYDHSTKGSQIAIVDNQGQLIPLVNNRRDLLGALLLFTMPKDGGMAARLQTLKNEIENTLYGFLSQKNTDRAACTAALDSYMADPINNMIIESGTNPPTTKQIVTTPHTNPNELSPEEKLNLLFKALLMEMR